MRKKKTKKLKNEKKTKQKSSEKMTLKRNRLKNQNKNENMKIMSRILIFSYDDGIKKKTVRQIIRCKALILQQSQIYSYLAVMTAKE